MPGKKGQADTTPGAITPVPRTVLARGDWWEIRAAAQPRAAELLIYGDIGEDIWGGESTSALGLVRALADIEADTLTARINSYGGSVADGLAIHNALRHHPAQVTTAIDGVAVSIASLIAMAGDVVAMAQNARLMIHAPWGALVGNANDAREFADVLDGYARSMASSYARKTGQTVDEAAALLLDGADHWYSADEALTAGLIDTITDALAIAASLPARFRPGAALNHPPATASRQPPAAPAAQQPEGNSMPAQTTPPDNVVDIDAVRAEAKAQALAADRDRRAAIQARFTRHLAVAGVPALLDACLDDPACQPEAAGLKLLDHIGAAATPINGALGIAPGEDEQDKRIGAQVDALLARMGRGRADGANPYRGLSLGEMARRSLARAGVRVEGQTVEEFAPMALRHGPVYGMQGTSDFPVVLENTLHKLVLTGYTAQPITYDQWCKIGDVSDFREWKRLVPGLIGNLDTVNEHGEYLNKNLPDATANKVSAVRRGNIVQITPETLVNDDIGYISDLAVGLGGAGGRAIERAVYALLESNPVLSDGVALFHATHGNLAGSGAAPTMALLDAAAAAMAVQKAPGTDQEYLDISPYAALANRTLKGTLIGIVQAEYDPDTANKLQKPNIVRGIVERIVTTPRVSALPWYLFADPNVAPVIEVVFLNGQREPRLAQEESFRTGGLSWRVELPFGVGAIDFRGGYKNPGA